MPFPSAGHGSNPPIFESSKLKRRAWTAALQSHFIKSLASRHVVASYAQSTTVNSPIDDNQVLHSKDHSWLWKKFISNPSRQVLKRHSNSLTLLLPYWEDSSWPAGMVFLSDLIPRQFIPFTGINFANCLLFVMCLRGTHRRKSLVLYFVIH